MLPTNPLAVEMPDLWPHFMHRTRALIRSIRYPAQTRRWLKFLGSDSALKDLSMAAPDLVDRIYHPYLASGLTCSERVDLLIWHYEFLLQAGLAGILKRAAIHPLVLCEFSGKSGAHYQLSLSSTDGKRHDGEWILRLISKGICIYTVAFVFIFSQGERYVKIGGLQGFLATDNTMRIKAVTRDLFGCRPRDLMVSAVRAIGAQLGCHKVLLISNRNKLPARERYACRKSSDYDRIWNDMRALKRADGDFELPCAFASEECGTQSRYAQREASLHSVPTRRQILLDSILCTVREQLADEQTSRSMLSPSLSQPAIIQRAERR